MKEHISILRNVIKVWINGDTRILDKTISIKITLCKYSCQILIAISVALVFKNTSWRRTRVDEQRIIDISESFSEANYLFLITAHRCIQIKFKLEQEIKVLSYSLHYIVLQHESNPLQDGGRGWWVVIVVIESGGLLGSFYLSVGVSQWGWSHEEQNHSKDGPQGNHHHCGIDGRWGLNIAQRSWKKFLASIFPKVSFPLFLFYEFFPLPLMAYYITRPNFLHFLPKNRSQKFQSIFLLEAYSCSIRSGIHSCLNTSLQMFLMNKYRFESFHIFSIQKFHPPLSNFRILQ